MLSIDMLSNFAFSFLWGVGIGAVMSLSLFGAWHGVKAVWSLLVRVAHLLSHPAAVAPYDQGALSEVVFYDGDGGGANMNGECVVLPSV